MNKRQVETLSLVSSSIEYNKSLQIITATLDNAILDAVSNKPAELFGAKLFVRADNGNYWLYCFKPCSSDPELITRLNVVESKLNVLNVLNEAIWSFPSRHHVPLRVKRGRIYENWLERLLFPRDGMPWIMLL